MATAYYLLGMCNNIRMCHDSNEAKSYEMCGVRCAVIVVVVVDIALVCPRFDLPIN